MCDFFFKCIFIKVRFLMCVYKRVIKHKLLLILSNGAEMRDFQRKNYFNTSLLSFRPFVLGLVKDTHLNAWRNAPFQWEDCL